MTHRSVEVPVIARDTRHIGQLRAGTVLDRIAADHDPGGTGIVQKRPQPIIRSKRGDDPR